MSEKGSGGVVMSEQPTNHNPIIDETNPAQTVYLSACAMVYLLSGKNDGELSKHGRVGRWVLCNAVLKALFYEAKRLHRLQKLEELL